MIVACVLLVVAGTTAAFWSRIKSAFVEFAKSGGLAAIHETEDSSDTPENSGTRPNNPGTRPRPIPPDQPSAAFPRRALFITVHNYLYANPIQPGPPRNGYDRLMDIFQLKLNFPRDQFVHLSDAARTPWQPVPPLKSVIEKTLTDFLQSSRKQDRIVVFFVGHSIDIGDEPYLVPIEGELDNAATLIPLKWFLEQMARCPARQKILMLDAHRFNPTQGLERPASGAMGAKFEALVKNPPAGVQVWAACSAGQKSLELDNRPTGVFLENVKFTLSPPAKANYKGALDGRGFQKPTDLIPLDILQEAVTARVQKDLEPLKITQLPLLTGKDVDNGSEVDPKESTPPKLALAAPPVANPNAVKEVLAEVSVPPLKVGASDNTVSFAVLPSFNKEALQKYEEKGNVDTPFVMAIHKARVALWAASPSIPPPALQGEVNALKAKLGNDANVGLMKDSFDAPGAGPAETRFKNDLANQLKKMAKVVEAIEEAHTELRMVEEQKETASKRWQANYGFIRARVEEQLALLEEYEGALGSMRKEFPPFDPKIHKGWRLAAKEKAGDPAGKKYDRSARKLLADLAKEHAGTPWEVLAKREKLTALGLEWQPKVDD